MERPSVRARAASGCRSHPRYFDSANVLVRLNAAAHLYQSEFASVVHALAAVIHVDVPNLMTLKPLFKITLPLVIWDVIG